MLKNPISAKLSNGTIYIWKEYCDLPIGQSENVIDFSRTHIPYPHGVISVKVNTN